MNVKRTIGVVLTLAMLFCVPLSAVAGGMDSELQALKKRIEQLEKKLSEQDSKIEKQEADMKELDDLRELLSNIEIDVNATSVIQASINNEDNWKEIPGYTREGDDYDANYDVDVEISSKIGENGKAMLHLVGSAGWGVNEEVASFASVNDTADGDDEDVHVAELWYEHHWYEGMLVGTFGKLDLTRWIDQNAIANDEDTQFLNSAFVNNLAIELPADYGMEDYTYGFRMSIIPNELFSLHLAFVETEGDFEEIFDDNLYYAEADFSPMWGDLQGNYRFYGWVNSSDHIEFDGNDDDDDGWGVGVSFDQEFTENITAFFRFGYQDEDIYAIEYAWSTGVELDGAMWDRPDDAWAIAYSRTDTSSEYRDLFRTARRSVFGRGASSVFDTKPAEHVVEMYYRIQLNKYLSLTPDVQWIENLQGFDADSVGVLGIRANLQF